MGIFWDVKASRGHYLTYSLSSLVKHFPVAAENCQNHLLWQSVCNLLMQFVITTRKSHVNSNFREQVIAQIDERKEWKTQVLLFPQEIKNSLKGYCDLLGPR